jgi:hypothetical protein
MLFESWEFTEWSTVTTILLSVVAIIIAIWSSRSTSKAAEKQIQEIKQLSALQIDTTIKQLEVEIQKIMVEVKRSAQESKEIDAINNSGLASQIDFRNMVMQQHQEGRALRDLKIYSECSRNLNELLENLKQLRKDRLRIVE